MAESKVHDTTNASSRYDDINLTDGSLCCPNPVSCLGSTIVPIVWLCSCVTVEENTGLVVLSNGKLTAAITDPGLHAGTCICPNYRCRTIVSCADAEGIYCFICTISINR